MSNNLILNDQNPRQLPSGKPQRNKLKILLIHIYQYYTYTICVHGNYETIFLKLNIYSKMLEINK